MKPVLTDWKGGYVLSQNKKKTNANKLLEEYCRQYKELLYKYAYLRTGHDKNAAEDCVQEAFMVIYRRLKKGEEFKEPKAFLYRTVDNLVKVHLRDMKKRQKIDDEVVRQELSQWNILDNLAPETEEEIIRVALSEMNDSEKVIYKQRYIENKNIKEIAQQYNLSITAVTTRLYRIRQKVEARVKQELQERGILND